jgi:hypothetical protein
MNPRTEYFPVLRQRATHPRTKVIALHTVEVATPDNAIF